MKLVYGWILIFVPLFFVLDSLDRLLPEIFFSREDLMVQTYLTVSLLLGGWIKIFRSFSVFAAKKLIEE